MSVFNGPVQTAGSLHYIHSESRAASLIHCLLVSGIGPADFSIRLDEKTSVSEFREMATNFNVMVKELENTEMLAFLFINYNL